MKMVLGIFTACAFALALSSCGNNSGSGSSASAATGPFDSRGNYVEEWADNPSKWRKSGGTPSPHERKSDDLPQIAKIDQPPQNSVPLPTRTVPKPTPLAISGTQVISRPSIAKPEEKIVKATKRPVEKTREKTATKSKVKPKSAVAKAKPKPKSIRYIVKKGDSLSTIASRTGSSVSAIRKQNGISGTIVRPGQSLVIPKR